MFSSCGIHMKQSTRVMLELSSRELHFQKRENRRGLQHIIVMPLVGYRMDSPENMEWQTTEKCWTLLTGVNACERLSEEPL